MIEMIATPTGVVCIVMLAIISKIIYQIFLHPLKSVPGPFWAKISGKYMFLSGLKGNRCYDLYELHEKYGPAVRVGPDEVSISKGKVFREVFNRKTTRKEPAFYDDKMLIGERDTLSTLHPIDHKARRKILDQTFTFQSLIQHEAYIQERIQICINNVLAKTDKSNCVDVNYFLGSMSMEILCNTVFNTNFDSRLDAGSKLLESIEHAFPVLGIMKTFLPFLPMHSTSVLRKLPFGIGAGLQSFDSFRDTVSNFLAELKDRKLEEKELRRFTAGCLMLEENTFLGRKPTWDEMVQECMALVIAGSTVIQHTVVYILWELSKPENKAMQTRLREELSGAGTSFSDVANLPFLSAIIKETYRMYPAFVGTIPRILGQPLVIPDSSITLPTGTQVGFQDYVHHRDASIFPSPMTFAPERWLPESKSELATDLVGMNISLTPFSAGPNQCLGSTLARIEIYLAVAGFVRQVEFGLNDQMTGEDMEMIDRWTTISKGGRLLLDVDAIEKL